MSPSPYWRGYLKLSLVSCPIALHAACASSERVAFRQVNRKTGNRLRQQLIDEQTREPVGPEDKGRGYEIGRGQYLMVDDAELEARTRASLAPRCAIAMRYATARTILPRSRR